MARQLPRTLALLALGALVPSACEPSDAGGAPSASWPEGTVLALDDSPILASEIDEASVYVERLEPAASPAHLRRLALTNIVLPRRVARLLDPAAHAKAKADAEELRRELVAGTYAGPVRPDGTVGELLEGGWGELGIIAWGSAIDLAEGEWSPVIEEVGSFVVLRRLGRKEGPVPLATQVRIEAMFFRWLEPDRVKQDVDDAYERHRLSVVDPTWRSVPPELLLHRMQARQP